MPQEELEVVVVTNDNPSDKFEIPNWATDTANTANYYSENQMLLSTFPVNFYPHTSFLKLSINSE